MWEAAAVMFSIIAAAISYGATRQKVNTVAADIKEVKHETNTKLTRIEDKVDEINVFLRNQATKGK